MIGGGARNPAIQQLAPAVLGADVLVPEPAEYVALGAARQAAWALAGTDRPPTWRLRRPRSSPPQRLRMSGRSTACCATPPWIGDPGGALQVAEPVHRGHLGVVHP